jgi:hypothetical protein
MVGNFAQLDRSAIVQREEEIDYASLLNEIADLWHLAEVGASEAYRASELRGNRMQIIAGIAMVCNHVSSEARHLLMVMPCLTRLYLLATRMFFARPKTILAINALPRYPLATVFIPRFKFLDMGGWTVLIPQLPVETAVMLWRPAHERPGGHPSHHWRRTC